MSIVLCAIGWVLLLLSLPTVIELSLLLFANLFMRSRLKGIGSAPSRLDIDFLAILIPAHDEELCIERCVASLLASETGRFRREVIVIADNCSDNTAALARRAGARVLERFDENVKGKGAAIHYAVTSLEDEGHQAYIIVDADSVVDHGFIRVMGEEFASGKEAIQCVNLPLNVEASPKIRLMNLALLSMNVLRPIGREILGCSVGIQGNGFGLTKRLLQEVPYTANSITEDLEYHLKLIERRHRVRFVLETKVMSDFPVSKEGTETQRLRWEGGKFLQQRTFFLRLARMIFAGRLSLIEPFLELLSMPLSYEILILLLLLPMPDHAFAVYALGGTAVIFLQTIAAISLYGTKKDFGAFLQIPGYLFWKLIKLPRILVASKKGMQWVRTKRE